MSAALPALALGAGYLTSILLRPPRSIGTLFPSVVVEEDHQDTLVITDHPVERHSHAVTDHAYLLPAHVTVRCGWSSSDLTAALDPAYIKTVYQKFVALQASRVPFDVVTGKRSYKNMLVENLAVHTDADSENTLMVVATCKQVIITQTQVATLAPQVDHAMPQVTAPVQARGTVQPTQSTLFQIARYAAGKSYSAFQNRPWSLRRQMSEHAREVKA